MVHQLLEFSFSLDFHWFTACHHAVFELTLCIALYQSFHCRYGKAYLFDKVVNVSVGRQEDRMMTTGKHTVADIFCNCCQRIVGWKYVFSPPRSIFPQIFFMSAAVPS
jgi:hypothetical protein